MRTLYPDFDHATERKIAAIMRAAAASVHPKKTPAAADTTAGAPKKADDCQGVIAMTDSALLGDPSPDTPRGLQLLSINALEYILHKDLPAVATWRVEGDEIEGQLASGRHNAAFIAQWAAFLARDGITPQPRVKTYAGNGGCVEIRAVYRDVKIRIWYGVDSAELTRLLADPPETEEN